MSDSDKTQGIPPGDTGEDARTPRARTRTRSRASAADAGAPAEKPARAPRAAKAPADADPAEAGAVVKRTTRKRTVKKADEAEAAGDAPEAADAPAEKAPPKTRAAAKPRASRAKAAQPAEGTDDAAPAARAPRKSAAKAATAAADAAPEDADAPGAEAGADKPKPRTRSRAKAKPPGVEAETEAVAEAEQDADEDDAGQAALADAVEDAAAESGEAAEDGPVVLKRTRRGRRGGRNRNRSRRPEDAALGHADAGADIDAEADVAEAEPAAPVAARAARTGDDGDDEAPTRLQARARRGGTATRGATATRGRGRQPGRRPVGGVSEEVRRVIAESPPRRMLVTVGNDRTQVAVLEERTLVEHYVTRKQDVSYVGNIYVGRVQNVLPGMEAAFVDIGKGRNGVLYAGEVNYDEADLDGELPRIEEQLKAGQTVLVQVTKDPMGTKGARLTQHLSIAGRYCVLAPGEGMLGISRKLPDDERERLRVILKAIRPEGYGLIVRTAAEGATREQLEADVSRLVRIWEQVDERAKKAKPLETVYEEPDLVIRVIRDVFGPEYTELIVDSEQLASQIRDYLGDVSPELVDRVKAHAPQTEEGQEPENLFDAYEVTNQIRRALEKKVWLKSGGYLIVEKTEAMWVIDVNTGKFVGERNLEATVLKNNLEAAEEIARQLRLRDMGGIIVIDFVDMLVPANRDEVLKRFKRELARDKTKSRVMEISKLGLVQMTRKNVSVGLQESFTTKCEVCEGRGAKIVDRIV